MHGTFDQYTGADARCSVQSQLLYLGEEDVRVLSHRRVGLRGSRWGGKEVSDVCPGMHEVGAFGHTTHSGTRSEFIPRCPLSPRTWAISGSGFYQEACPCRRSKNDAKARFAGPRPRRAGYQQAPRRRSSSVAEGAPRRCVDKSSSRSEPDAGLRDAVAIAQAMVRNGTDNAAPMRRYARHRCTPLRQVRSLPCAFAVSRSRSVRSPRPFVQHRSG